MVDGRVLGRRVIVPVHVRVFEELVAIEPAEELLPIDVLVRLSVLVARLLGTSRRADRIPDVHLLGELARDRALPHAGRADEDDEDAKMFLSFGHYLLYCSTHDVIVSA